MTKPNELMQSGLLKVLIVVFPVPVLRRTSGSLLIVLGGSLLVLLAGGDECKSVRYVHDDTSVSVFVGEI